MDGPIAFAHRGGLVAAPENSLAAFQHAVDLGYRYLETDVHATRDGALLAFHDATLHRVTDSRGRIADLGWDEISRVRIAGREPIARLEDLLAAWPDVRLNIDAKSDVAVEPLIALLRRPDVRERVCIGSFSDDRLRRVREAVPGVCTSAGPAEVRRLRLASVVGRLGGLLGIDADCVQVPVSFCGIPIVDRRCLAHCHDRGLPVHVWTVNDRAEVERLLDLGVDGIITDDTAMLRDVLRARGSWPAPALPN